MRQSVLSIPRSLALVAVAFILTCSISFHWVPSGHAAPKETSPRLQKVERVAAELPGSAGQSATTLSLSELMKAFNVPGLSIAVIENYKIVDAKAYGVIAPGSSTPVTTYPAPPVRPARGLPLSSGRWPSSKRRPRRRQPPRCRPGWPNCDNAW